MKIFLLLLFFTVFFCSTSAYAQTTPVPTPTPPESDFQLWHDSTVFFPIVKRRDKNNNQYDKLTFFLNGNLRAGRSVSRFVDERIGFGFDYRPVSHIIVTPSILFRAAQPYEGNKETETRLRFAVTFEKKSKKYLIANRVLAEHRLRNNRPNSTRYRNRFNYTYNIIKDNKEIFSPFITDEVYYDHSIRKISRNELFLGITKKFNKNTATDFFYVLQKNRGNILSTVNAFGISLRLKID